MRKQNKKNKETYLVQLSGTTLSILLPTTKNTADACTKSCSHSRTWKQPLIEDANDDVLATKVTWNDWRESRNAIEAFTNGVCREAYARKRASSPESVTNYGMLMLVMQRIGSELAQITGIHNSPYNAIRTDQAIQHIPHACILIENLKKARMNARMQGCSAIANRLYSQAMNEATIIRMRLVAASQVYTDITKMPANCVIYDMPQRIKLARLTNKDLFELWLRYAKSEILIHARTHCAKKELYRYVRTGGCCENKLS